MRLRGWDRIAGGFGVVMAILCGSPRTGWSTETDPGWPREIVTPDARIVVYEPQPDSLRGNTLWGRAAVSITPSDKDVPTFGALWFVARLETDRDTRMAHFADVTLPRVRFPKSKPEDEAKLASLIQGEVGKWDMSVSMDRLTAGLQSAAREQGMVEGFDNSPPRILWEKVPAILVRLDGEPRTAPLEGWKLDRVLNTPFLIVRDRAGNTWYLEGGKRWFSAPSAKGPWSWTQVTPTEVEAYAAHQRDATAPEQDDDPAAEDQDDRVPKIIVATDPTELIVTDGELQWVPIADDALLYVGNTESDVFRDLESQDYFVLIAGRWYRGPSLADGPWTFVRADNLPAGFAAIPEKSPKGDVLVNVAGTQAASDALADAEIPQTAAIRRDQAMLTVEYDGEPRFERIPSTSVEYAVNTGTSVLRIGGRYYACDQGVWFASRSPRGPWEVADDVPDAVQDIPPDSPVYNVRYVHVYDATPTVVYVGYTPGYVGCYPYWGTVVYGTGWSYRPWWGHVYYPRFTTWGWNAHYTPWTGWSFGMSWGAGWSSWSYGWWEHPGWAGGGWWGPCGYAPWRPSYVWGYRPPPPGWTHRPVPYRAGPNGRPVVAGSGMPRPMPRNVYSMGNNRLRNGQLTRSPRLPARVPNRPNDVYTDRAGNLYRRTPSGGWQQRDGNVWRPAPTTRPAEPATRPGARPATPTPTPAHPLEPSTRPSTPATRPSTPSTRPGAPTTRPGTSTTRPGTPTTRPATPSNRSAIPATRPSGPAGLERDHRAREHGAERTREFERTPMGSGLPRAARPAVPPKSKPEPAPSPRSR